MPGKQRPLQVPFSRTLSSVSDVNGAPYYMSTDAQTHFHAGHPDYKTLKFSLGNGAPGLAVYGLSHSVFTTSWNASLLGEVQPKPTLVRGHY